MYQKYMLNTKIKRRCSRLEKETFFQNKYVKLVEKENYMVYETLDIVCVLPVLPNGNFLLINQYRIPIGKSITELVTGGIEKEENPETASKREILEETGYTAHTVEFVGSYYSAPGYITQKAHVFIARLSEFVGDALEEHERVFNLKAVQVTKEEMEDVIEKGETHPYLSIAYHHYKNGVTNKHK